MTLGDLGDIFGGREISRLRLEVATLRKQLADTHTELVRVRASRERLKRKARRLIDIAWNRAVDAAYELAAEDNAGDACLMEIEALKRKVRE